jgi:hypothetical protein
MSDHGFRLISRCLRAGIARDAPNHARVFLLLTPKHPGCCEENLQKLIQMNKSRFGDAFALT